MAITYQRGTCPSAKNEQTKKLSHLYSSYLMINEMIEFKVKMHMAHTVKFNYEILAVNLYIFIITYI